MIRRIIFLAGVVVSLSSVRAYADLDAKALVEKADEFRVPPGSVSFTTLVRDYDHSDIVRETRYQVYNRGHEKSLVQTTFPERQRGNKLLMNNDSLWFSSPNIKRAVRVTLQQKMTGEVANGDLARTNFAGDYVAKVTGKANIGGEVAYQLTLTANRDGVTYPKILYFVRQDGMPVKASFFALSGKLLKTADYAGAKDVLGRKCLTKTVFRDALNPSKMSVMVYANYKRQNLPDLLFNKEAMND